MGLLEVVVGDWVQMVEVVEVVVGEVVVGVPVVVEVVPFLKVGSDRVLSLLVFGFVLSGVNSSYNSSKQFGGYRIYWGIKNILMIPFWHVLDTLFTMSKQCQRGFVCGVVGDPTTFNHIH